MTDADGRVVVGTGGYLYFGAARNLPGVRELLEKKEGTYNQSLTEYNVLHSVEIKYLNFRLRL